MFFPSFYSSHILPLALLQQYFPLDIKIIPTYIYQLNISESLVK